HRHEDGAEPDEYRVDGDEAPREDPWHQAGSGQEDRGDNDQRSMPHLSGKGLAPGILLHATRRESPVAEPGNPENRDDNAGSKLRSAHHSTPSVHSGHLLKIADPAGALRCRRPPAREPPPLRQRAGVPSPDQSLGRSGPLPEPGESWPCSTPAGGSRAA